MNNLYTLLVVIFLLSVTACGGGSGDDKGSGVKSIYSNNEANGNNLPDASIDMPPKESDNISNQSFISFATGASGFEYSSEIHSWQSYSFFSNGRHYWSGEQNSYTIEALPRIENFYSGYAYVDRNRNLIYHNLATAQKYTKTGEIINSNASRFVAFSTLTHEFRFDHLGSQFLACSKNTLICVGVPVVRNSTPYTYAEASGKVLAITNYGDVLKFDGQSWCRMGRDIGDIFSCSKYEPMIINPRVLQFYASIKYQGNTLLGEWPSGSTYIFDGEILKPSVEWTPPELRSRERKGYEAQSMAEYCGDLFIGYWPRGEVWRYSRASNSWSYFHRFFSQTVGDDSFIPWSSRIGSRFASIGGVAFLGQRITALVPFENSLYVSTSNIRMFTSDVYTDDLLTSTQRQEYGASWKITGNNCFTEYYTQ